MMTILYYFKFSKSNKIHWISSLLGLFAVPLNGCGDVNRTQDIGETKVKDHESQKNNESLQGPYEPKDGTATNGVIGNIPIHFNTNSQISYFASGQLSFNFILDNSFPVSCSANVSEAAGGQSYTLAINNLVITNPPTTVSGQTATCVNMYDLILVTITCWNSTGMGTATLQANCIP